MVSKNSKRNPTLLFILGASFFGLTLYSGEIIAALVKSNLISLSLEQIGDDVERRNTEIFVEQKLEEVSSDLQNTENMLLKNNKELNPQVVITIT